AISPACRTIREKYGACPFGLLRPGPKFTASRRRVDHSYLNRQLMDCLAKPTQSHLSFDESSTIPLVVAFHGAAMECGPRIEPTSRVERPALADERQLRRNAEQLVHSADPGASQSRHVARRDSRRPSHP